MNAVGILLQQQLPMALEKNEMKQMETNQDLPAQSFHELLSYKEEVVKVMEQLKQLEAAPLNNLAVATEDSLMLQTEDAPEDNSALPMEDNLALPTEDNLTLPTQGNPILQWTNSQALQQQMIKMGGEQFTITPFLKEKWLGLRVDQVHPEIQSTENEPKPILDKQVTNYSIPQQIAAIFSKVEPVLAQVKDQQDIQQATTKLADLLHAWSELSKQAKNMGMSEDITAHLSDNKNVKEVAIWKQLVAAFEKRSAFVQKQHYNSEAKVTSGDVAKWLTKALESISETKQPVIHSKEQLTANNGTNNQLSVPMARLEQHIIYLQPQQSTPRQNGQELMQQLQRIMNSSKFMKLPNGANQLNLTLRPQHLGDMSIRLTQLDGVMTVRILVQSQAAKEMLESNIHKLRNMFSPQQVVIEKQEGILQQGQQTQRGNGAESQQYPDQQEQQQQQSEHENTDNDAELTTSFQEILLNEQV